MTLNFTASKKLKQPTVLLPSNMTNPIYAPAAEGSNKTNWSYYIIVDDTHTAFGFEIKDIEDEYGNVADPVTATTDNSSITRPDNVALNWIFACDFREAKFSILLTFSIYPRTPSLTKLMALAASRG